jgi:uncharacterized DUF497 family protein
LVNDADRGPAGRPLGVLADYESRVRPDRVDHVSQRRTIALVVRIEWDEAKNRANRLKHGLSFEQAAVLFERSADYLVIYDDQHSADEDRFLAIGPVSRGIATVVYTEPGEDVIRIIGARRATRGEAALFRRHIRGSKR